MDYLLKLFSWEVLVLTGAIFSLLGLMSFGPAIMNRRRGKGGDD